MVTQGSGKRLQGFEFVAVSFTKMLTKARFVSVRVGTEWARVSLDVVVHIKMIMKQFSDSETFPTDRAGMGMLFQVNPICVSYQTSP